MTTRRGRGFRSERDDGAMTDEFDRVSHGEKLKRGDPAPSIEGWVVIATGLKDVCGPLNLPMMMMDGW